MIGNPDFLTNADQDQGSGFQELESPEGEPYLRFYVPSGNQFAIPAIGIREVLSISPEKITPIPNTSPLLLGTMNWRGQVLWVADLGQFLGDNIMLNTETTEIHVIVIEDQETLIALAVDRRVDMEWLDTAQLEQVMTGVGDLMAPFLKGEWLLDSDTDQKLRLLDHVAIIRSARWAT